MSTGLCPIHGVPWKVVPAGISTKTGKPYNSFQACQIQGCTQRPPRASNPAPRPLPQPEAQSPVSADPRRSDAVLQAACLNFAARLYQGMGQEWEGEAKRCAQEVYEQWRTR
jgi:hypothetical protein